jgi:molybdate transport system permease protein
VLLAAVPVLLLLLPVLSLIYRSFDPAGWVRALSDGNVRLALALSLRTTTISLILVVLTGTPLAYFLARHRFPGKGLVEMLLDLPMVLPPAVAGVALLMAFGRMGTVGRILAPLGVSLAFTPTGVILAQCFVSAPFFIRSARNGFAGVDPNLEHVAATLGVGAPGILYRVTLPLAAPGLLTGAAMAWARAMGEFGATLMFAGNFPGQTQTMSLAIYTAMESDLAAALTLSLILLVLALLALGSLRLVPGGDRHAP